MYLFTAGMGIGLTGLQAAQNAINVTGQNITNINTPGYARQRVNLETGFSVQIDKLQFGLGVNVRQVQSIRDRFLDMQLTQTITHQFGTKIRYEGIENIASVFVENGESGLDIELQRFFQAFEELAARPENDAVRTNVVTRAQTLISGLQARYNVIEDKRTQANRSAASIVNEVNIIAAQIAKLNHNIASEVPKGSDNNSRDQRQALVDKLAELVGIQCYEDTHGRLTITVENGMPIVSGSSAMPMIANSVYADGSYIIEIEIGDSGQKIDVTKAIKNGTLGGYLDLRDNILVGYMEKLDQLAAGVVYEVNQLHRNGVGIDGVTTNLDFFVAIGGGNDPNGLPTGVNNLNNYKGMISRMGINGLILNDPQLIASGDPLSSDPGPGNNEIALKLAELQNADNTVDSNNTGLPGNSGPFTIFISSIANKIGNEALNYKATSNTDENIRAALEIQRDRLSAVDFDEEATNLIVFQRSYQACSRFIGVINQLTDQLVNNFGK
ncbi:MAG: flagellar hook-associated protein FlgK [Holophagales bacterium]|jgi:flagellar hook-associated protein 1 FlgK|nr:flagellar hook-associated protein FlgK [Holophagales bacterium]